VSPWSRAERESEAAERELFVRRARALEPAVIPSLASVLRAADDESRESDAARNAHGRTFVAMALAAACMMAAATKLPTTEARGMIAAERDAGAPRGYTLETASAETCTLDDAVLFSEEKACSAPVPLFSAAPAGGANVTLAASSLPPPMPASIPTPASGECGGEEPPGPDAVCR
jgi:hypothetical protein